MKKKQLVLSALMAASPLSPAIAQSAAGLPQAMTPVGTGYGNAVPPVAPNSVDNPAFASALNQELPLTAPQITYAKKLQHEVNQALATQLVAPQSLS